MSATETAIEYFLENYEEKLSQYIEFLKIPSISTDPACKEDMEAAQNFLAERLRSIGMTLVQSFPTDIHPILYAENTDAGADAPTLLIYGHYDVQPPDPLNEWCSAPFDPQIRGDYLYARGASDMKGQVMATIVALESVLKTSKLPINVKFLLEGEEEIGSPSLDDFIAKQKDLLKCDMVLNPDSGMVSQNAPTIVYGLRGLVYFELRIDGPKADLHSGLFGGNIANPAIVLSEIIAKLHNPDGSVAVPGFYDKVIPITPEEKARINSAQELEKDFVQMTGVPRLYGEKDFSPLERAGARPTLDVNGLYSGFIGEGAKTIIPAYAKAKISCRIVPNQEPDEVYSQIQKYIASLVPDTVRATLFKHSSGPAYLAQDAPGVNNLINALTDTWNQPITYKREGGSVPVATTMQRMLGVKSLLTGFGLPDDGIHSPNEHQHLPTWKKGVQALIRFYLSFAS
ncbi:MAG: dipeptidase [Anaerolineaceae bacterium]|jgi:acetylornithine deacetylase/succinyl-diaminopimelate desuccinylase-like protein